MHNAPGHRTYLDLRPSALGTRTRILTPMKGHRIFIDPIKPKESELTQ